MAPVATFMLSLVAWAVVPFDYGMVLSDPNIGLLYLFAISSLGVYGIIIAGWSSDGGFAFEKQAFSRWDCSVFFHVSVCRLSFLRQTNRRDRGFSATSQSEARVEGITLACRRGELVLLPCRFSYLEETLYRNS